MISKVLIVEDETRMRKLLTMLLSDLPVSFLEASNGKEAWELFNSEGADLIISDLKLPGIHGMDLLKMIKEKDSEIPIIVITAYGSIENAVEAIRMGAFDYITKPFEEERIRVCVTKALRMVRLLSEVRHLRKEIERRHNFENIIGESATMCQVLRLAGEVAETNTTVLITGESGTGKELLSKAIHFNSRRATGPFVAVNCATIPTTLLEAEMFGYEKGAFTGALNRKPGKFELASDGTLFLDEIGDMNLDMQAKLLRVLEEQEFERLGGTRSVKVDIRLIAATNKDLAELVAERKFRNDLYYRINVFPIHIPPLRERKEDIPLLAKHFVKELGQAMGKKNLKLTEEAIYYLQAKRWPGNVRELKNVIERAMILCQGDSITRKHLIINERTRLESSNNMNLSRLSEIILEKGEIDLEGLEKEIIKKAMKKAKNNVSKAARILGLTRATLRYRLEKYRISV